MLMMMILTMTKSPKYLIKKVFMCVEKYKHILYAVVIVVVHLSVYLRMNVECVCVWKSVVSSRIEYFLVQQKKKIIRARRDEMFHQIFSQTCTNTTRNSIPTTVSSTYADADIKNCDVVTMMIRTRRGI